MLQSQTGQLVYGPWRRRTRHLISRPTVRALFELAPPVGYSPDFLTPAGGYATFDKALDAMLSTPQQQIRDQLAYLDTRQPASPWIRRLAEADRECLHRLGLAVRTYFQNALAPYWRSIDNELMLDRMLRARQMTHGGIDHLLSNLHPRIRWEPPVLEILDFAATDVVYLDGRGLELLPSYFCWGAPTKLRDNDLPPVLVYPIDHLPGDPGAGANTATITNC